MKRLVCLSLWLVGCGDPPMMNLPDQPQVFVQSNTQDPSTKKPANLACLGSKVDPAAPTAASALMVHVEDFEKKTSVVGATVEVYLSLAKVNARTPDATSAPTDKDGNTMLMVPPGSYRVTFRTFGAAKTVETLEFNRAYNDGKRFSVSEATKLTITAVLSLFPDETLGVVAGALRDCDGKDTGGVTLATGSSGGAFEAAANTFYFEDVAVGSTVPVRALKWTSGNGVFATLNVPPGDATLTVSGVLTPGASAVKLGTGVAPVRPNSITVVQLEPLGP
jgi:hypothetical protein